MTKRGASISILILSIGQLAVPPCFQSLAKLRLEAAGRSSICSTPTAQTWQVSIFSSNFQQESFLAHFPKFWTYFFKFSEFVLSVFLCQLICEWWRLPRSSFDLDADASAASTSVSCIVSLRWGGVYYAVDTMCMAQYLFFPDVLSECFQRPSIMYGIWGCLVWMHLDAYY